MKNQDSRTKKILQATCELIEDEFHDVIEMTLKIETIATSRKTVRCLSWHCNLSSGSIVIDELEPGHIGYVLGKIQGAHDVEPCYRLNSAVTEFFVGGDQ